MSWFKRCNDAAYNHKLEEDWNTVGIEIDMVGNLSEEPTEEERARAETAIDQAADEYVEAEASKPTLLRWLGL